MKKFYTLLATAALTLSASALTIGAGSHQLHKTLDIKKELSTRTATLQNAQTVDKSLNRADRPVLRKADANESIEGEWTFTFGDYYFQTSINGPIEALLVAELNENNQVMFSDPNEELLPFLANFDAATGTLTFTETLIGTVGTTDGSSYYTKEEPFVYNYTTQELDSQDITGKFDASTGTISFEEDNGIAWAAYSDQACTAFIGYFSIYDLLSAAKEAMEPEIEWTLVGEGQFLENIITPLFTAPVIENTPFESTTPYAVQVYCDAANPAHYQIADAWRGLYDANKITQESPAFTLDATDPTNVMMPMASSGLSTQSDGLMVVFGEGWYNAEYGKGEAMDEALKITLTRSGDNVTITFPYHSTTIMGATSGNFYYGSAHPSTLTFTQKSNGGIENVVAGNDADAPVEFFNLQGVRVANPAAGQLVIKRQGSTVSKIVVR